MGKAVVGDAVVGAMVVGDAVVGASGSRRYVVAGGFETTRVVPVRRSQEVVGCGRGEVVGGGG